MCGIAGIISEEIDSQIDIKEMCEVMSHRGPDGEGIWIDSLKKIGLGHRRLSIIDLSVEGAQPMTSFSGRYILSFNGEIYNFHDLKQQVISAGFQAPWRGQSDTEVILAAVETWGIEETIEKLNGMFAIAFYDQQKKELHLIRDRMGEKPLYYGKIGNTFYFCSELKSIKKVCKTQLKINREALALYMRHGYVPAPWSIYEDIYKLQPAHRMVISVEKIAQANLTPAQTLCYWSLAKVAQEGECHKTSKSDSEFLVELERRLKKAVKQRMVSDVDLGAFLSGGYDSSLIVALMQEQSPIPVKTFSIGFDTEEYNEAIYAKAVASHLGTNHTELYVTPEQAMAVIQKLPKMYCEPFADSSQIPTFLVSQLAKTKVTVSLSGDAGDELFGGYNRYFWSQSIWSKLSKCPVWLRKFCKKCIYLFSVETWNKWLDKIMPKKYRVASPGEKLYKLAELFDASSIDDLYYLLVSGIKNPREWVITKKEALSNLTNDTVPQFEHPINRMMFLDMISYLPDDILVKVDRASMATSLECRVPFLDHELVEFAWEIPIRLKIREGQGKWILKQLTHTKIPKELMERPKMGFGIPLDQWLRGPLREWGETMLDEDKMRKQGYLNTKTVQKHWKEHLSGKRNWSHQLWTVIMFQRWIEENFEAK